MKTKIFSWLGKEFIEVMGEAKAEASPEQAMNEMFQRCDAELRRHGLSLDEAVRLRVWGREKNARTLATAARSKILTGNRRAASSSFISEEWFDSAGAVGLELLAMRPADSSAERYPVDFEPPRNYLCYLDYEGWLFFSGFTSEAATLEKQTEEVVATIESALIRARTDWSKVVKLSALVLSGHDMGTVRRGLAIAGRRNVPEIEYSFVDGFAGEKYLLEIEATALKNHSDWG